MRITFVLAASDLSGGCRVVSIYADRLRRLGHEVTVVSRPRSPVTLRDQVRALLKRQPIPRNRSHWPSHLDSVPITHRQIESFREIRAEDIPDADVVIATWWETAEWVSRYPRSKGAKAYFLQHLETHLAQDAARVEATWRLPMQKIVIAEWLARLSRDQFGDADYALVPNSVDLDQFCVARRCKRPLPTVGLMYSIVPFKGCDISLKAFQLAAQAIPGLKLVSFGNRPSHPSLPLPKGADHTVQPAQDRIRDIYAQCDVWLVGSRSEGFGLPILEAMACRTPVIATPTGAAPELLASGGGILVPHDDPLATARAIEKIIGLPESQWQAMSDQAYATASRYTWDDATALFVAAFQRAIDNGR